MWMIAANFRQTQCPSRLAWSEGGRPPGASLHSSDESGELSQWLWSWWQHHKHCHGYYYYLLLSPPFPLWDEMHTEWDCYQNLLLQQQNPWPRNLDQELESQVQDAMYQEDKINVVLRKITTTNHLKKDAFQTVNDYTAKPKSSIKIQQSTPITLVIIHCRKNINAVDRRRWRQDLDVQDQDIEN